MKTQQTHSTLLCLFRLSSLSNLVCKRLNGDWTHDTIRHLQTVWYIYDDLIWFMMIWCDIWWFDMCIKSIWYVHKIDMGGTELQRARVGGVGWVFSCQHKREEEKKKNTRFDLSVGNWLKSLPPFLSSSFPIHVFPPFPHFLLFNYLGDDFAACWSRRRSQPALIYTAIRPPLWPILKARRKWRR